MKKTNIIAAGVSLLIAVIYFIGLKMKPAPAIDDKTRIIDSLRQENSMLRQRIKEEESKAVAYEKELDLLEKKHQKIIRKYVPIYKKIDTLTSDSVVGEFKLIFSGKDIE